MFNSIFSKNIFIPTIKLSKKDVHNELNIVELIILSKLEKSKSEIRSLIKGYAIKLDDQLITHYFDNWLKISKWYRA